MDDKNLTKIFDEKIQSITNERGGVYGHPADDFARVNLIKEAVRECPDPEVRHALEMIGVKLARLVETPDHLDSAVDIAGYARTIVMINERSLINATHQDLFQAQEGLQGTDEEDAPCAPVERPRFDIQVSPEEDS
jgi:hypothetical protein